MYRHFLPCFLAMFSVFLLASPAWGQAPAKSSADVLMSYPLLVPGGQVSPIRITGIDRGSRQARLTLSAGKNAFSLIPQGESILLLQDDRTRKFTHAVRVNITERLEKGEALFEFGPEAAKLLKDCPVLSIIPFYGLDVQILVSTRRLKELPEIIAIAEKKSEAGSNAVESPKMAAMRAMSVNNMKQIMLAMQKFHDANGSFPPAVIYGPDGKPWHSWRVLLLPFLERNEIYKQYDFSKPWDAPENAAVRNTVVEVYKDPIYGNPGEAVTHYAVLVGETTMFPASGSKIVDPQNPLNVVSKRGRNVYEVTDGLSNTIAVVPVADDRKIPWAKPEDIVFGPEFPGLGKPGGIATPYVSKDGKTRRAPVAKVDGAVFPLHDDVPIDIVRAMITFKGGEAIEASQVRNPEDNKAPKDGLALFKIIRKVDGSIMAVID